MGVLSLHNECPPLDYGAGDAQAVCHGLMVGEEGTSATLKAIADCINALAAMDDTVGAVVGAWRASMSNGSGHNGGNPAAFDVRGSYLRSFETLAPTAERIDNAVKSYRELADYARSAVDAGRGAEFQASLQQTAGDDFEALINRRVELLRKLKVRVLVLHQLRDFGLNALETFQFPDFFMLLMQPLRDVSVATDALFSEVVRGALASHQSLFRVCRLAGWDAATPAKQFAEAGQQYEVAAAQGT